MYIHHTTAHVMTLTTNFLSAELSKCKKVSFLLNNLRLHDNIYETLNLLIYISYVGDVKETLNFI